MNDVQLTPVSVREIVRLADEIERSEAAIKSAILSAARAGDCATVITIVTRWQTCPVTDVLESIKIPAEPGATALDPCGDLEVTE